MCYPWNTEINIKENISLWWFFMWFIFNVLHFSLWCWHSVLFVSLFQILRVKCPWLSKASEAFTYQHMYTEMVETNTMVVHGSKCGAQTFHGEEGKELTGGVKPCTCLEMPHYLCWCLIYQTRACAIGWAQ